MSILSGRDSATQQGDARGAALRSHVAEIGDSGGSVDAVALGVVDATLAGDGHALHEALAALRDRRHTLLEDDAHPSAREGVGAIGALSSTTYWALERLPSAAEAGFVASGTMAARFLAALAGSTPVASADLRTMLETDETQVSRTGRGLLDAGLVARTKIGRTVSWELSPRGRQVLEAGAADPATPAQPPRSASEPADHEPGGSAWWRELMRRAWIAPPAEGHQPSDDPVRDRILHSALELHTSQGVLNTTWPDIAEHAGIPVAAVSDRFSTVEELVPACGGLAFRQVRVPPPEESAALFGDQDLDERIDTLVATLFEIYDRGALELDVLRREGGGLPVLGRARDAIEEGLDALITAALGPPAPDEETIALVRALAGVPVWRAMRAAEIGDQTSAGLVAGAMAGALQPARDLRST